MSQKANDWVEPLLAARGCAGYRENVTVLLASSWETSVSHVRLRKATGGRY